MNMLNPSFEPLNIAELDLEKIIADHYPEMNRVHPAANIFPLPSQEQFLALCENISEFGLLHPIVITESGALVDGRSRLLACYCVYQDIRVEYVRDERDLYAYSIAANLKRRHLNTGQLAAVAAELEKALAVEAKQRQRESGGDRKSENAKIGYGKIATSDSGKARDKAAEAIGVSSRSVGSFKQVEETLPEVAEQIKAGTTTLADAQREVKKEKQRRKEITDKLGQVYEKPTAELIQVLAYDGESVTIKKPKKTVFNATNDSVSWAKWTWNPITGCNHGCNFCYAREIADSMGKAYPFNFKPAFYPHRLEAPKNTPCKPTDDPRNTRVFVCSMADLFGKWVPDEWIQAVFDVCLKSPQWQYLFLTKWPNRYSQMPLIENAWYGASIIQQKDVTRVTKAMKAFKDEKVTKWISMEPMLEPIVLEDLSWCDLVVIGSQTETRQPTGVVPAFAPHFDWVVDVVLQCRAAGVPYYLKPNLGKQAPGMVLPEMMPR